MKFPRLSGSSLSSRADGRGALLPASLVKRAVLRGLKGGLIATAVMTLYRLPVFRALPPTAEFWAEYVGGGEPEQYTLQGILLHFLYGALAGGVFAPLFAAITRLTTMPRERVGIATGAIYGGVLSVFGTEVVLKRLLDDQLEPEHELVFHVGHLIYGLTLGTWISTREALGEVYRSARNT